MPANATPGPYSIHVTSKEHIVRGRHGAIMRRYPNAQAAAAMEDLRRLQKGYSVEQKRLRDAAPELLAAVIQYRDDLRHAIDEDSRQRRLAMVEALISKATSRQPEGER